MKKYKTILHHKTAAPRKSMAYCKYLLYIVNTMTADDPATKGAQASVAMVYSHFKYKDMSVVRPSYTHNKNAYTDRMPFLYWLHIENGQGLIQYAIYMYAECAKIWRNLLDSKDSQWFWVDSINTKLPVSPCIICIHNGDGLQNWFFGQTRLSDATRHKGVNKGHHLTTMPATESGHNKQGA